MPVTYAIVLPEIASAIGRSPPASTATSNGAPPATETPRTLVTAE